MPMTIVSSAALVNRVGPGVRSADRQMRSALTTATLVFAAGATLLAQTAAFRARLDLVQVTVSVTDAAGRLVTGLTRDDFQVWEDGIEQQVTQFTDERVPVSLGVLLDASDSMRGQAIVDAQGALDRFVGELLFPDDQVFVATFNHLPRLAARWKRPPRTLANILMGLQPSGGTAIYDALAETAPLFERRDNIRAAFVVISDGADTASDRTLHQAIHQTRARARESIRRRCATSPRSPAGIRKSCAPPRILVLPPIGSPTS
jgi:Mg-chelatase subunit ChlD